MEQDLEKCPTKDRKTSLQDNDKQAPDAKKFAEFKKHSANPSEKLSTC